MTLPSLLYKARQGGHQQYSTNATGITMNKKVTVESFLNMGRGEWLIAVKNPEKPRRNLSTIIAGKAIF